MLRAYVYTKGKCVQTKATARREWERRARKLDPLTERQDFHPLHATASYFSPFHTWLISGCCTYWITNKWRSALVRKLNYTYMHLRVKLAINEFLSSYVYINPRIHGFTCKHIAMRMDTHAHARSVELHKQRCTYSELFNFPTVFAYSCIAHFRQLWSENKATAETMGDYR